MRIAIVAGLCSLLFGASSARAATPDFTATAAWRSVQLPAAAAAAATDHDYTTRPTAPPFAAGCNSKATCAIYCNGAKAKESEARKKFGPHADAKLVSLDKAYAFLGCSPGKKAKDTGKKCGLRLEKKMQAQPPLARALALAALRLRAINKDYVVVVQDANRDIAFQVGQTCAAIASGHGEACGTGHACPGSSPHLGGVAFDLYLENSKGAKLTQPVGNATNCAKSLQDIKREKDQHAAALNHAMFSAGFYRYCNEHWHFELTRAPANDLRTNCLDDHDCGGGKKCVQHKTKISLCQ